MPFQEATIAELVGQDRNSAEGVSSAPRVVQNLEPASQGGYQVRGVSQQEFASINFSGFNILYGADHKGYSSLGYVVTEGSQYTIRTIETALGSTGSATITDANAYHKSVHIPGAGWYAFFDNFRIYGVNNSPRTTRGGIYPDVTVSTGGNFAAGDYGVYAVLYLRTRESRLALMALRNFVTVASGGGKINVAFSSNGGFSTTAFGELSIDVFITQKLTSAFSFHASSNNEFFYGGTLDGAVGGTISFDAVPIGDPLSLYGFGLPYVVPLSDGNANRPIALHRGRIYFVPSSSIDNTRLHHKNPSDSGAPARWVGATYTATAKTFTPTTLAWTEQNTLNLFNHLTSYQPISPKNSTAIVGLSSTQEGLLIFCQNETFIMRGDPSFIKAERYQDFNFNPLFPIGLDEGCQPGELGPTVFTIWKGEVYQIDGGFENISTPVFDRKDRFIQVVGEVERNCIVCLTQSGRTFYYYPANRFWGEGPSNVRWIMPSPTADGGTRYVLNSTNGKWFERMPREFTGATRSGTFSRVVWELDMGVKFMRKELAWVRLAVNQDFKTTATLTYRADRGEAKTVTGRRKGDELLFPIKVGCVGRIFTLDFKFDRPWATDTIEAPLLCEFSPRDVKR